MSSSQVSSYSRLPTPGPSSPSPAFDRRGSALNASSAAERKARREQLRAFYGIKGVDSAGEGGVPEQGSSGGPSKPRSSQLAGGAEGQERTNGADELDIGQSSPGVFATMLWKMLISPDSPAFNASGYLDDLVAKASLAELMKRASSLSAEVGNLQSSRHSLVYHHHHQLFSAGDTIAVLNTRTPQLISIVNALQDSFSSISQLVDAVALPEKEAAQRDGPGAESADDDALRRNLQRLKLMIAAEGELPRLEEQERAVLTES